MNKVFLTAGCALLLLTGERSFSQSSFQFFIHDSIVYDAPKAGGDTSCEGNYVVNKTPNGLTIDVVRVQDVDILGSGWQSAFCLDICYVPTVDSMRYTIPANGTVDFIPHFYYTATPD